MTRTEATHDGAEEYLPLSELCRRLSISRATVYRHGLHAYGLKVGGSWRFPWSKILAHYAQAQKPDPEPKMLEPGTYRCTACYRVGDLVNPLPLSKMACSCGAVGCVFRRS